MRGDGEGWEEEGRGLGIDVVVRRGGDLEVREREGYVVVGESWRKIVKRVLMEDTKHRDSSNHFMPTTTQSTITTSQQYIQVGQDSYPRTQSWLL